MAKLLSAFLASRSRGAGRYLLARRAGGWWGVLAAAVLPAVFGYVRRRRHGAGSVHDPRMPALGDRGSGALRGRAY